MKLLSHDPPGKPHYHMLLSGDEDLEAAIQAMEGTCLAFIGV